MDTALIIAIIGQIITLAVVFIQQMYNNKNLKMQLDNGNKKDFYIEKRKVYKKLIKETNIEKLEESNFNTYYFNLLYDDVFLYGSKDIIW